jgi:hypothetical protein
MQQSEGATGQRVSTFNGLFAYHRALLIATFVGFVVAVAVLCGWVTVGWPVELKWGVAVALLLLLALFWYRTKQRSFYYAREVLLTAERIIDAKPAAPAAPAVAAGVAAPPVAAAPAPVQAGNGAAAGPGGP